MPADCPVMARIDYLEAPTVRPHRAKRRGAGGLRARLHPRFASLEQSVDDGSKLLGFERAELRMSHPALAIEHDRERQRCEPVAEWLGDVHCVVAADPGPVIQAKLLCKFS